MAAEPSVDGCGVPEGRAARRLAADRAALFLRAADDVGGLVRVRFEEVVRGRFDAPVLRAVRRPDPDAPDDLVVDLAGFLVVARRAAPAFRLPVRAGAALRAPPRFAAAFAPFVFFFCFAERFFAAFAMSLPPG